MESILVTGANGFVGRALCRAALKKNMAVVGAVRNAGARSSLDQGVRPVIVGEIGPDTDWKASVDNVDYVVHLAARVHLMEDDSANPLAEYRKVNVDGLKKLAEAAAESGVKKLVFLSSIKVNGEGRDSAYNEDDEPQPDDPYGVSKWEAEQLLRKMGDAGSLRYTIIRPPLVYGPGVKANFLKLIKIVNRGVPLPLGLAANKRSMIYLENLTDAILTAATSEKSDNGTYLVSDGEDVSVAGLIRSIAEALGKNARLVPVPIGLLMAVDCITGKTEAVNRLVGSLTVDSSRFYRDIDWKPPFTMKEGLKETARWFRETVQ